MKFLFDISNVSRIVLLAIFFSFWITDVQSQSGEIYKFRDTAVRMRVRLVKVELTPHCGIFAFTAAQKFEIVQAKLPDYPGRQIILLQKCPELLGPNFFEKDRLYDVIIFKDQSNGAGALNSHMNEKLPTYLCGRIDKISK